jgi:integrase
VAKAMRRACNAAGIADLASHDLRRTMSSWLAENGTSDSTLDKLLAHAPRGVTRKHYVVATFDREMREALEKWTAHLTLTVGGAAAAG